MSQLKRASLSLAKPLDRGVREEIERDVVYNSAAKEVSKWVSQRLLGWAQGMALRIGGCWLD
jgi:hypothetical protein